MQALFFTVIFSGGFVPLGSVVVENSSPCRDIVEEAEASPVLGDDERANVAYTQCQLRQPKNVDKNDCHEFARLYQLARHYSQKSVVPAEFCSTLKATGGGLADSRTMGHSACVAGMSKVLGGQHFGEAADQACLRIYAGVTNAATVCKKLVSVLAEAPDDGTLDTARLCDKLLAGANGTRRLDREHFLYSCVQYASNVVADSTTDRLILAAQEVQRSCREHFSIVKRNEEFCSGYADLVRNHASSSQISRFCGAQYQTFGDEFLGRATNTRESTQTSAGMTAMCQHAATQVVRSGHESGAALQHRAEEICVKELQNSAPHAPQSQVHLGCRFFAKHLDDEVQRSGAEVDVSSFCEVLGGRPAQLPTARSLVPQLVPVQEPQDEELLNGFLSAMDAGSQDDGGTAHDARPSELDANGVTVARESVKVPQDQSVSTSTPDSVKLPPDQSAQVAVRSTSQKSSSFLRPATPHKVEPQTPQAALQTSTMNAQSDGANVSDGADGSFDIDTLVSLFQSTGG